MEKDDFSLSNYRRLIDNIDARCRKITESYARYIACKKGCDDCCRHISAFPVEAAAITAAVKDLPADLAARVRRKALNASPDGPCPLLEDHACLMYAARPVICRTHGMALLVVENGARKADYCPKNFRDLTSLPAEAVIDLEKLNTALSAVNALFTTEKYGHPEAERIPLARAVLAGFD